MGFAEANPMRTSQNSGHGQPVAQFSRCLLSAIFGALFLCFGLTAQADEPPETLAKERQFKIGVSRLEQLGPSDYAFLRRYFETPGYGHYVAPNEVQPNLMLPLVANLPPGTLVSVGTQRCFMAAATVTRVHSARCFDYSHGVLIFNLLNARLIEVAQDVDDYRALVVSASAREWYARFTDAGFRISPEQLGWLFQFWSLRFHRNPFYRLFKQPPTPLTFADMNYMYDQQRFARLQQLIRTGKLVFDWIDVTSAEHIAALTKDLLKRNERVSLLDLSNIVGWTGFDQVVPTLLTLAPVSLPESLVMLTDIDSGPFWTYGTFKLRDPKLAGYVKSATTVRFTLTPPNATARDLDIQTSRFDCRGLDCTRYHAEFLELAKAWTAFIDGKSEP